MNKNQLARDIIERHPTLSKAELGRRLHKENPGVFSDFEKARHAIRVVTGAVGSKSNNVRSKQSDKYIGPRLNPGYANDFTPYFCSGKRIGLISDVHIPYHDRTALHLAMSWIKEFKADTIILNGDIIDCYQLSNFVKDPKERKFSEELNELHNFLSDICENFPDANIIYKMGNHEERYERFLLQNAKDIDGITDTKGTKLLSWESLTHASRYGHEIVTNKRIIKAGKLNIVHGHEFGKSIFSPVNPARGFYLRAKTNVIGGHYHQTSEHIENNLNGDVVGTWSTGCLCDLHPAYMPLNKWNLGFAAIEVDDDSFTVYNKKIMNGKIV